MERPPENDCCSVCHDDFTLPCQANCSHWFCGQCIVRVWHFGPAVQPCKCPICRRSITLLIPGEIPGDQLRLPEASSVLTAVEQYNRLFGGGPRSLIQRLQDLPFFMRRLFRELMDPQRSLPLIFRARMIFTILFSGFYVLSPVDIIPEAVFGIAGFFDDMLILLIVFMHLSALYRGLLLYRHGGA
ncbi:hypothetical protein LUZ60_013699 [Juncus effusus]|nr:hypothetical protein LUZ60_013699 [Juncus effusus]